MSAAWILSYLKFNFYYNKKISKFLYIRAISGALSGLGFYYVATIIPLADADSLYATCPICTLFLAGIFLGENLTMKDYNLSIIGFLGVILISKPVFLQ